MNNTSSSIDFQSNGDFDVPHGVDITDKPKSKLVMQELKSPTRVNLSPKKFVKELEKN